MPSLHTRRKFLAHLGLSLPFTYASPLAAQSVLSIHPGVWNPLVFGARGDGITNDTDALQRTIDRCARAGGGIVALPPDHTFLSGTLVLHSHVELHLAGGSTLLASPLREHFHQFGSLLFAKDAADIRISGTGTIDGNCPAFFPPKGPNGYAIPQPFLGPYDPLSESSDRNPPEGRPRMILLVACRGAKLSSFTIRNSPTWTIHPIGCDDLLISGVSIFNDLEIPNCDGIDIDHCRQVRIDNCNIVSGDDCLVLKASRNFGEFGPCEGITITNCTLESSSAGIKIETEGPWPLRSAVISNCSIVRTNRGISFLNRDGATVEDIVFSDLVIETAMRPPAWWGAGEAIAISSTPRHRGGTAGLIRAIQFSNIVCKTESGIYLRGSSGGPLRDISFRGIQLDIQKNTAFEGGFYDMRPGDAFGDTGLDRRNIAGVFAEQVEGLRLNDVRISWRGIPPVYYGAALELHHCLNTSLSQVTGVNAQPNQPAVLLDDVTFAHEITPPKLPPTTR